TLLAALGNYTSRIRIVTGNATIQAAERTRAQMPRHGAAKLEVAVDRVGFGDGRVFDVQRPELGLSFEDAVRLAEAAEGTVGRVGSYTPPPSPAKYRGSGVGPPPAYSYSACVAEVDVDAATGVVRVPRIWIVHDVVGAINAASVM